MSAERHTMRVCIDDGFLSFNVRCPYDRTDRSRPCWPWDLDRDEPEPLPEPQQNCTYLDWSENLSPEDYLHGDWFVDVGVIWEWNDGSPSVQLRAPVSGLSPKRGETK